MTLSIARLRAWSSAEKSSFELDPTKFPDLAPLSNTEQTSAPLVGQFVNFVVLLLSILVVTGYVTGIT
jgi:hypothetical protein